MQRRVSVEELPAFAPDSAPTPLTEQKADPALVKSLNSAVGTTDGIPNAPGTDPDPVFRRRPARRRRPDVPLTSLPT